MKDLANLQKIKIVDCKQMVKINETYIHSFTECKWAVDIERRYHTIQEAGRYRDVLV